MTHRAPIIISAYDAAWPLQFAQEQQLLQQTLPSEFRIEHIGSTSISGLAAKPIIDIILGAESLKAIEAAIPQLIALGYQYMPQHEATLPQRRFFAKPVTRPRIFHLHGTVIDGEFWHEHIVFRDKLRANPDLARRYAELKIELARRYGDDRGAYTDAKTSFIHSVLTDA